MPVDASPQRPAGPPAVVVSLGQHETAGLQWLAALRTELGVVGHTANPRPD